MDCTYCIVPKVRPNLLSRPVDQVVEEVRRLVGSGHREIVLTGIHLGLFGVDLPHAGRDRVDLASLVRQILTVEGEFRIRLSSLEAAEITSQLLDLMADYPQRICSHLHIPLQSGSDSILSRMRRRWTAGQFAARCEEIRRRLEEPALTTDVIVGFPGESDADFEASCRVVRDLQFSRVHIFRFSPREGTLAAALPDQLPPPVKQHRAEAMAEIDREASLPVQPEAARPASERGRRIPVGRASGDSQRHGRPVRDRAISGRQGASGADRSRDCRSRSRGWGRSPPGYSGRRANGSPPEAPPA